MLISVKLLTKYVIISYALGSVHEKFGRSKVASKAKFPVCHANTTNTLTVRSIRLYASFTVYSWIFVGIVGCRKYR